MRSAAPIVMSLSLSHETGRSSVTCSGDPAARAAVLARDVEAFNTKVYDEIFLTPDHDAWLGLVPDDTYAALENDGCACQKHVPQ